MPDKPATIVILADAMFTSTSRDEKPAPGGVAIEGDVANVKPFHDILMAQNCTFLEVLQNLDQLKSDTFFISYAPIPIIGLDSCPVRVYAIEGLPGFTR